MSKLWSVRVGGETLEINAFLNKNIKILSNSWLSHFYGNGSQKHQICYFRKVISSFDQNIVNFNKMDSFEITKTQRAR